MAAWNFEEDTYEELKDILVHLEALEKHDIAQNEDMMADLRREIKLAEAEDIKNVEVITLTVICDKDNVDGVLVTALKNLSLSNFEIFQWNIDQRDATLEEAKAASQDTE